MPFSGAVQPNQYEERRNLLIQLLIAEHEKHKVYGYHSLASVIHKKNEFYFSDNLTHKCCKYAGIHSVARKKSKKSIGKEHMPFKNVINGNWNSKMPPKIVVSDMTCFYQKGIRYEWMYILDTFNNEIIAHSLTNKYGDNTPYYECLDILKSKILNKTEPVILHTDQGSVYTSKAFMEAHKQFNIMRSRGNASIQLF